MFSKLLLLCDVVVGCTSTAAWSFCIASLHVKDRFSLFSSSVQSLDFDKAVVAEVVVIAGLVDVLLVQSSCVNGSFTCILRPSAEWDDEEAGVMAGGGKPLFVCSIVGWPDSSRLP